MTCTGVFFPKPYPKSFFPKRRHVHKNWATPNEQWKQPWLLMLHIEDFTIQLYGDYLIHHDRRIPITQPVFQWKARDPFFWWLRSCRGRVMSVHLSFAPPWGVDVLATNPTVPYRLTLANGKEAGLKKKLEVIWRMVTMTGWWFKILSIFTPNWGRFPILTNIFQRGWFNHQFN